MTPERWARIEALFEACLEVPPADRAALFEERAAGDEELRREVEELLRHAEEADQLEEIVGRSREEAFVTGPERPSQDPPQGSRHGPSHQDGEAIGPYRLESLLGEGGMGSVWRARRADGEFEQAVAIKFVGPAGATRGWEERFRNERQIHAQLEHPHIARLLDGGSTIDGQPYLVMELVEGEELLAYCDQRRFGLRQRLRLFLQVASAVEHAHHHLVVHRDLKPANILVHPQQGPKLLDFGIAKILAATESGAASAADPTQLQNRLLTPDYASPEQVLGRPVTTASDVYSLGVILFELLCGHRPRRLQGLTPADQERQLTEAAPARPSTLVRSAGGTGEADPAALRGLAPTQLARTLQGDLDTIALKALQTDPARRYSSVAALAADLERYLAGEPVAARPDSWSYRTGKLVRRHPWGSAAVALIALLLLSLVVGLLAHSSRLQAERDRARAAEAEARTVSDFLMEVFQVADPGESRGETVTARELLDRGSDLIESRLEDQPEVQASLLSTLAEVHLGLGLLGRGEELHRRALARRRELHGDDSLEAAASRDRLGDTLRMEDRWDEAEEELRKALEIREARLPANDPAVADSLNNLGLLLLVRDDYAEAEPRLRRALQIRLDRLGPEHPDTDVSRANLVLFLHDTGRVEEAVPLAEDVVQRRVERFGETHPKVANSVDLLGQLFHRQGRLEEAETQLRRSLAIRRKVLPEDHAQISDTLNSLASLFHDQLRLQEAEAFYREVLEIDRMNDATGTVAYAYTLNNLASLLKDLGRYTEAADLYRRSLELRAAAFGEESGSYQRVLSSLAQLYVYQGRLADAEPFLLRARAWQESHPDAGDTDRLRTLERLGHLRRAQGDLAASVALFRDARAGAEEAFPPEHPLHLDVLAGLMWTVAESGEPEACAGLVEEALASPAASSAGPLVRGRMDLSAGICFAALGRRAEARQALGAVLDALRASLGEGNVWVGEARARLASLSEEAAVGSPPREVP